MDCSKLVVHIGQLTIQNSIISISEGSQRRLFAIFSLPFLACWGIGFVQRNEVLVKDSENSILRP